MWLRSAGDCRCAGVADIEAELRSTLEDMLEDRGQKTGRPADEALATELLKEYGSPEKVAATYHSTPYLIGPRLYPFFLRVLRIVFSVLTVVLLVMLGIQIATQPLAGMELAKAIGDGLLGILNAALQAFGNIVLVFAILERVMPASASSSTTTRRSGILPCCSRKPGLLRSNSGSRSRRSFSRPSP